MLGGKIRLMVTGSAPIAGEVLDFLKICFCADIIEGYGMTETCAGSFATIPFDPETGHVGGPLANVKCRLRDIPEMGHLHTNDPPSGEICMWGSSITEGYFRNPEKTAETITEDGWLYTGDVGRLLPNGAIKIIDRAKNIFKLSQGEYIAPEKLENVYVQSIYVAQAWIYGDSLRDYIIGFFVVDPENVKKYCEKHEKTLDQNFLDSDTEFRQAFYDGLMQLAGANRLNSLEKPKQIKLILDPWTTENEYLTPTLKMKRNVAKDLLADDISASYAAPVMAATKK